MVCRLTPFPPRLRRPWTLRNLLSAGAALVLASLAAAQDPVLRAPLAKEELSRTALQARLDAAARAAAVDPDLGKELTAAYQQALSAITAIEAAEKRLATATELRARGARRPAEEPAPPPVDAAALRRLPTDGLAMRLRSARAEADTAGKAAEAAERRVTELAARGKNLPGLLADAERTAREAEAALLATAANTPDEVRGAARRTLAVATFAAAAAERDALAAESSTLATATELAAADKERTAAAVARAVQLVQALQGILEQRMQDEAERMIAEAGQAFADLQSQNKVLREAAEQRLTYARKRREVLGGLPEIRVRIAEIKVEHAETRQRFLDAKQMILHVGFTQTAGDLLREYKLRLPDVTSYRVESRKRQQLSSDIRVDQLVIRELLGLDEERFIQRVAVTEGQDLPRATEDLARETFEARRTVLEKLQRDYDVKLGELAQLETEHLLLTRLAEEFEAFIDEKILWVRSTVPIWSARFDRLPALIASAPAPDAVAAGFARGLWADSVEIAAMAALLLGLLLARGRLKRTLARIGERAASGTSVEFLPTLAALLVTGLLAAPYPLLLAGLAIVCGGIDVVPVLGAGLASGLWSATLFALLAEFTRRTCAGHGVARAHLGWRAESAARLWRFCTLAALVGVPLMILVRATAGGSSSLASLVSRPLFVAAWIFAAVIAGLLFRPSAGILSTSAGAGADAAPRSHHVAFLLAIALPASLAVLAAAGLYFTAGQLASRLLWSAALVSGLVFANGIVARWQLVSRRRLAFRQRRERLEAARAAAESAGEAPPSPPAEERLDVAAVSAQAQRLTRTVFGVAGLVSLYAIWAGVLPALGGLREIRIGPKDAQVSLAEILLCLLTIGLTVVAAKNLPGLLKLTLLQRIRPGNQYAIAALVQYGIVVLGTILAFGAVGIGWSKVQWLVAAVSLGLGFGLQEIFANFVSGIILLFERPIRVGDFVTVGTVRGEVTRIRIRATTVRNLERQELIVPNKEFITGQVINWTLSDRVVRMVIVVGIAYGSDVQLAQQILLRIADENPHLVKDPKPKAIFTEFGDSALNFELRIFMKDLDHWTTVLDSVHQAIDREFRAAGIEIAFPQRDLHLRSVDAPFPVTRAGDRGDASTG